MKIITKIALLICLTGIGQTQAQYFKEAASAIATGIDYTLSFTQIIPGIRGIMAYDYYNLPDASAEATAFFREQLRLNNVTNYQNIRVKLGSGSNYEAYFNKVLVVAKSRKYPNQSKFERIAQKLQNASEENRQHLEDKLSEVQANISHEATHLRQNDTMQRIIAAFLIPCVTFAVSKKVESFLPTTHSEAFSGIGKILGGLCRATGNLLLFTLFARYQEQRADDRMLDNVRLLSAFKNAFRRWDAGLKARVEGDFGDEMADKFDNDRFYYYVFSYIHDSLHPTHRTRIAALDKHIAKIKKIKSICQSAKSSSS